MPIRARCSIVIPANRTWSFKRERDRLGVVDLEEVEPVKPK